MVKTEKLLTKAQSLLDEMKYQEVKVLLPDKVLDKHNNAELYFCRAWAHYQLNENSEAVIYLEKSASLDALLHQKLNGYGNIFFDKGENDKAISKYEKALFFKNDYEIALYNKGLALFNKGEYNKAIDNFCKAIENNYNNSNTYFYRGMSYHNRGEYKDAILDYNEVIKSEPDKFLAFYNRGLAYYSSGENDNALNDLDKTVELNPNYAEAYLYRGLVLFKKEEYVKTIAEYTKSIDLNENYVLAYFNRGVAWSKLNDYNKAIADYDKALHINPEYTNAYHSRGLASYNLGDYNKAIDDFSKVISLDSDYNDAYFNRALAYYYIGEYDKSIADYDQVILTQPDNTDAYLNRGLAWNYKAKYDKAIVDYNEVISRKSEIIDLAYINRGIAFYYKGQFNEAIEDYSSALKINNKTEYVFNNRGLAWFNKGFYNEAIIDYNDALQLKPDYPDAYINRAMVWYDMDEFQKAIDDCTKALELNSNFVDAYNVRGSSKYYLKEFDEAVDDFLKIIGYTGYEATGNTNIGDVFSAKGDFQKAAEYYEKAEKEINIPDWLKIPLKQKKERNNQRLFLLKTNVTVEELAKHVHLEERTEKILQKIKKISKSDTRNVVHYTKIFVADIYVSSLNSKMHYSNAIYMNDPMEGKVFFEFLDDENITQAYIEGEKRNEISVYLGSFLPAENSEKSKSHDDELVMWRTYGKDENGNEAGGCNLVLSCDFFSHKKKQPLTELGKTEIVKENSNLAVIKEEYFKHKTNDDELLNVIYLEIHDKQKNIRNDLQKRIKEALDELKSLLNKMIKLKNGRNTKIKFKEYIENTIFKQLSTISYLFKSADYIYENEVRVIKYVSRDSDAIKFREVKEPNAPRKRFYIESNNEILPYIRKIYLGPKAENHQQWSLYLDFEIRHRAKEIQKMDSPPFKLDPSIIQILKSTCKFQ